MRLLLAAFAVIAFSSNVLAQEFHSTHSGEGTEGLALLSANTEFRSIHSEESARHSVLFDVGTGLGQLSAGIVSPDVNLRAAQEKGLTKRVFGWCPYWMQNTYASLSYPMLSTVAYFSYEVDTATGSYKTIHSWKTTDLVSLAHEQGTNVVLAVTNFGNANNAAVLRNPAKRRTLIDSLMSLVAERNADGVNIDFEGITDATLRDSLTTFMRDLAFAFHSGFRPMEVSIALPAVDWSKVFDVQALGQLLDYCVMMGYDYHWAAAPEAGPVAPLDSSALWGKYSVLRSVRTYLTAGLPAAKLLLGVPYYGYEWRTASLGIPSSTLASGSPSLYSTVVKRLADNTRQWDAASSTPYFLQEADTRQCWYDDAQSLGLKYDAVGKYGLGGVGIWALGYDGDRPELWDVLREKFVQPTAVNESGEEVPIRIAVEDGRIVVACQLRTSVPVSVDVYDVLGRLLVSLDGGMQNAGRAELRVPASSLHGVLLVRVRAGERTTVGLVRL